MGAETNTKLIYGCRLLKYRFPKLDRYKREQDEQLDIQHIIEEFNQAHERVQLYAVPEYPECEQHQYTCFLMLMLPFAKSVEEHKGMGPLSSDNLPVVYPEYRYHIASISMGDFLQHTQDWKQHEQELLEAARELGQEPDDVQFGVHSVAWYDY